MGPVKWTVMAAFLVLILLGLGEAGYRVYLRAVTLKESKALLGGLDRKDVFELYAIGGSGTLGQPYADWLSIPHLAGMMFNDELAGKKILIRNLARPGDSIYPQALALARKMKYRDQRVKAAVLIYSGNNEGNLRPREGWDHRLSGFLRKRLFCRSLLLTDALYAVERKFNLRLNRNLDFYGYYLERAVESSLEGGALPILSTVVSNISGVEPGVETYPVHGTASLMKKGMRLEKASRYPEAVIFYQGEMERLPYLKPLLTYRTAKCYQSMRKFEEAKSLFWKAVGMGPDINFSRAKPEQNDLVKNMAARYSLPLVDAVALFEKASPDQIIGNDLFMDGHHPNMKGYLLIAGAFAEKLSEAFDAPLQAPHSEPKDVFALTAYVAENQAVSFVSAGSWILGTSSNHPHPLDRMKLGERNFGAALKLDPENFSAWLGLGYALAAGTGDILADPDKVAWWGRQGLFFRSRFCVPEERLPEVISRLREGGVPGGILKNIARTYPRFYAEQCGSAPWEGVHPGMPGASQLTMALRVFSRHIAAGEPRKALALLEAAKKRFSNDSDFWVIHARASVADGNKAAALSSLRQAEARGPGPRLLHEAALLYYQLGECGEALRLLRPLAEKDPRNAVLLKDKGICEYLTGAVAESIETLSRSIKIDPGLMSSYLSLGTIYSGQKREDLALEVYERALKIKSPALRRETGIREKIIEGRLKLRRSSPSRGGVSQDQARARPVSVRRRGLADRPRR